MSELSPAETLSHIHLVPAQEGGDPIEEKGEGSHHILNSMLL